MFGSPQFDTSRKTLRTTNSKKGKLRMNMMRINRRDPCDSMNFDTNRKTELQTPRTENVA